MATVSLSYTHTHILLIRHFRGKNSCSYSSQSFVNLRWLRRVSAVNSSWNISQNTFSELHLNAKKQEISLTKYLLGWAVASLVTWSHWAPEAWRQQQWWARPPLAWSSLGFPASRGSSKLQLLMGQTAEKAPGHCWREKEETFLVKW